MKQILLALFALLLIPVVYAAVDVTYVFDQSNVNATAFNCLDASCSQVGPFGGSFVDGPYVTDGSITIRYPDSLNTHGYGVFFVSKGFRPLEIKSTWNTNGVSGLGAPQTVNYYFSKMPNICRATVSELNFVNEVKPHVPMVINTNARLDARTSSAFQLTDNEVGYVPNVFKQEYYGADTVVKMEILQNNAVVYSQQKEFTAVKGNALVANSNVPVAFTYVPSDVGNFNVKVVAQVVDDQCQASEDTNAQGSFSVLESDPIGRFYSILNQLKVNNTYPKINDPLLVTYNKITNFADASSVLTPVQTDVDYIVKNGASTVYSRSSTLFANPDTTTPVTYSFTFVPATAGVYNITVKAKANSALPTNNPEITAEQSMLLTVIGPSSYNVMFNVRSADNGSGIPGASVTLYGAPKATDANGQVTFESVPEGTYTYTITATNFSSKSDVVKVTSDKFVSVVLHGGETESEANTAPFMNLPDSMQIRSGTSATFNYHHYVSDEQDADRSLILTVTGGNDSIAVSINQNSGIVSLTPQSSFAGTNVISFRLNDTQNATASDSIVVVVSASTSVPVFSTIPGIVTAEDSAAVRVLNLRDYVSDADTPVENLVFSVVSVSNASLASAEINDNQYLTVYPKQDANGAATINVGVADGVNTANAGILLNVTPVNDAPVVVSVPRIPVINESTNYTLDLSKVFRDVDGDALTYYVTPANNITFDGSNAPNLSISPDFNVNGTRTFNVTAVDPFNLNATARFTLYLSFVDDAPFFTMVVPNIQTFEEVQNSIDLTPFENDPEEGLGDGSTLYWKMRWANETNVTPGTYLNTSLFSATLTSSTDYLLIQPKANQTGSLNVTLFLYDSTGKNNSQNITVTVVNVNDAPVFVNLSTQYGEAGVPFVYQLNATDSDPTNDTLSFSVANSTLAGFSMNGAGLINFTPSINGVFNIVLTVTDNFNASTNGTLTLRLNDTTAPAPNGQITPANPSVYAPNMTYTFGMNWTDNGNITGVTFEFNNLNVTNVTQSGNTYFANVSNLSAGNYSYRWFALDNASNLNVSSFFNFTVLKANSSLDLYLNGTGSNMVVQQNSTIPLMANLTNTTGSVSILRNGVSVASGNVPLTVNQTFTAAGVYNITATFGGSQNYSAASVTYFVTVPDTTAPVFGTISSGPASPVQYTNFYSFSAVVTDDVSVNSVLFELDSASNTTASRVGNTSNYQVNLTTLSVGNHTFKWFANDTSNNWANSSTFNYTVIPGTPVINLTINGISGNTSMQAGGTINVVASMVNPAGGNVSLDRNGTVIGTSALVNYSNPEGLGASSVYTIPYTASFAGDASVSAGNLTYYVAVLQPITLSGISPASGSSFNYSFTPINVTTSAATTCRWDFSDVAQQLMANSFTTSNGVNHVATITGMSLGSNSVSVACNNQTSTTNTDLVFIAQNILDGSTFDNTSTINSTVMKNSLINMSNLSSNTGNSNNNVLRNVTASTSTINNSVLTNCVISNATVLFINASNCNLANGFYDPSDLTGSNIDGNVRNSNVTYSNVTNSNITNSNINNSVITGSTIVNSSFSNAVVTSANITNNVIYSGSITYGSYTYTATTPANLSQVIPVAPVANFAISGSTVPGSTLTFTSTSTDANIPGPLNDSLSYNWTFSGDNATYATANVSKAYANAGTYNATLVVKDAYNLTSTVTKTFTMVTPTVYTGGSSGGGGGGGSGGGSTARIALTNSSVTKVVSVGQPLSFTHNNRAFQYSVVLRSASGNMTEWVLNGIYYTIRKGEHFAFDLSKDNVPDVDLAILDVGRNAATITARLPGAPEPVVIPPLPFFNFGTKEAVEPVDLPEVPIVEEPETDEKTVPVQADVKDGVFARMSNALKGLFSVDAGSTAVKVGIVLAVVVIGLAAYLIFVRWESF